MIKRFCIPFGSRAAAWLLTAAIAAGSAGCRGRIYDASALPAELAAKPSIDVERLNISALAETGISSQIIQNGDMLTVAIATGVEEHGPLSYDLRVAADGTVQVPTVGMVQVAGLDPIGAERAIRTAAVERQVYLHPSISVLIEEQRKNRIVVTGAVEKPGTIELPVAASDLMAAISAAGGLTEEADSVLNVRQTVRDPALPQGRTDSVQVDLEKVAAGGTRNFYLFDGAVVSVPRRNPDRFQVMGLVRRPDQFEIPPGEQIRLLDGIAMAGGRTTEIADKVRIVRQTPGRDRPIVIDASIRKAKSDGDSNLLLASGDVISVEETPTTFALDLVRTFVRIGFSSSMGIF